jgi:hypothetical protein
MGSYIGALWACGYSGTDLEELAEEIQDRKKLWKLSDPVLPPLSGLFHGQKAKRHLMKSIGEIRFEDLARRLLVVTFDLDTKERLVIREGRIADAVHASCAMPGIIKPVVLGGHRCADGGVAGFAASLFAGQPDFRSITPFPVQTIEDRDQGDAFLRKLNHFLEHNTDPDEIDESGEISNPVLRGLAKLGAFGIKIPHRYGGLGLSQTNYSRAAMALGAHCGNLTALLSAHQSIGVPQPLIVFGTEAQKNVYLRDCARGAISAFALTEREVGSDPARMKTIAKPSADGSEFILNGEKIWCTNVLKAK